MHGPLEGIYICENFVPLWIRESRYSVRGPNEYKAEVEAQPAFFLKANDLFSLWNESF